MKGISVKNKILTSFVFSLMVCFFSGYAQAKLPLEAFACVPDFTYVELEDGDHFLSKNKHRLTTFKAIEAFLAEHLVEAKNENGKQISEE